MYRHTQLANLMIFFQKNYLQVIVQSFFRNLISDATFYGSSKKSNEHQTHNRDSIREAHNHQMIQ